MRRHKKSKFDPYINEITKYVMAGMTVREIAELVQYHFDDVVDESAVYSFMRSRGLKSKVTQGGTNPNYDIPNCDECKDCIRVINTRETETRVCMSQKRIIPKACMTSPMFCPKRPFDNEKKYELLQRR